MATELRICLQYEHIVQGGLCLVSVFVQFFSEPKRRMSAQNVNFLFTLRTQLKLHHWQTYQFSTHKATDDLLKQLDDLIDEYVETYMGEYGRPKVTGTTCDIHLKNMSEKAVAGFVKEAIVYLQGKFVKGFKPSDTALLNLRDEMIGALQKVLYLFTLHG